MDQRLAKLASYDILDTQPEVAFDDIVLLASHLCETPVALVSFVEQKRQWFKATVGFEPHETPINQSVCAHVLGRASTLVIPDLTLDHRTLANPLVTGDPFIRFYAGAPLVAPDGAALGALCVIDTKPRDRLSPAQIAGLEALARQVISQLELRREVRERRELDLRRHQAIQMGDVGIWDLDLEASTLELDARMRQMNGVSSGHLDMAGAFAAIHPDDLAQVEGDLAALVDGHEDEATLQYRVIGIEDRKTRIVLVNARAIRNSAGKAMRLVGAARDITSRIEEDARRTVLNQELAHRLKNTLAVVQSIAMQTLRSASDLTTARNTLDQRIQALAQAHDILLTGKRDTASIDTLIHCAMKIHDDGHRVQMNGPDMALGTQASLSLALILHELATNASKYGALSVPDGQVRVCWSVVADPQTGVQMLSFEWKEVGGPATVAPTRKGFGAKLIEMGLGSRAKGSAVVSYPPDGVHCAITASLSEVQADHEVAT